MAIIVAVLMVVFLSIAAMAIDIGHVMTVRNELQNAADAAALAGALNFYPPNSYTAVTPNWTSAESGAQNAVTLNASDGAKLYINDSTVIAGYWNLVHVPYGLQPQSITPGSQDFPAVQVTITRSNSTPSGPVYNWFAEIFNVNTTNVSATATALVGIPGAANPGALLPWAINQYTANMMASYNSTNPFQITVTDQALQCGSTQLCGQWTTFQSGSQAASTISNLIDNGNPNPVNIGDSIWTAAGTKASDYHEVINDGLVGTDVTLPVTAALCSSPGCWETVVGFVGFHITSVTDTGSVKYIAGYLVADHYAPGTNPGGGSGPNYGSHTPPVLVQ